MKTQLLAIGVTTTLCHPFTYAAQELTQQVVSQTVLIEQGDDWLKLKSGEVIKGELTGTVKEEANSFDQEIEFDSDDLGEQDIEMEDIDILQTASFFTIRTTSGEIFDGYLSIQNQRLYLLNNGQQRSFPVEQVVSIYRGAEEDSAHWETELFLGLDISKGNTDDFSLLGEIEAERNNVESRTKLKARHQNSKSEDETIANNTSFDGSYDIYLNNRLFFRPLKLVVVSDEFQNLDYQVNASMQMGYFVIADSDTEWDVSVGPGYQYTDFKTVEEGESGSASSTAMTFESNFEYELTDDIDFSHSYNLNWASDDAGGTRHTNELGLDIDLIADLDFSVKAIWEHVSNTKADSDGVVPEKDDYKLHFGFSYEI